MAEKLCDLKTAGGGYKNKMAWYFSPSAMQSATDANPLIVYGDFSDVDKVGYFAPYSTTTVGTPVQSFGNPYAKGVTGKYTCGSNGGYTAYRNVTIYDDRIEIGSGFYGTTESSYYGYIKYLSVFNSTADY